MSFLDAITDFMSGSRKRAHLRGHTGKTWISKKGKVVHKCHAYPFPHTPGSGKCHGHVDSARFFGKKPKSGRLAKGPYFKKPGTNSPFHECVSKHMYAGASLPVASRRCSKQRSARIKGAHKKSRKHQADA